MPTEKQSLPIACSAQVFSSEERVRWTALRESWKGRIRRVDELPDGYAFELEDEGRALLEVAEWVGLERRCCPFLSFRIEAEAGERGVRLCLVGRPEVKEFLREQMGSGRGS